ncbi:hypothetical protein ACFLST_01165 [Chloroflexota bacterium]
MKRQGKIRRFSRDQAGHALLWTVLLLMVTGLVLPPMMLLMSAGLTSADVHEDSMRRFYAADAGIEDGKWQVLRYVGLPDNIGEELSYTFGEQLNNCAVEVTIRKVQETTYQITSTSTDVDDGRTTSIESYVAPLLARFSGIYENVITSPSDVIIQPNSNVVGTVQYNGELDNKGEIIGELVTDPITDWPTNSQLSRCFRSQVNVSSPYPYDTIDLNGYSGGLGPMYRQGSLTIRNTDSISWSVQLDGTLYVTGDLVLLPDCVLELNGQNIYVEGTIALHPGCSVSGSGCIIANGDIDFQPNIASAGADFVFLISITGYVTLRPADSFYGSVAGDVDVDVQPGCNLEYRTPNYDDFNFPPELPYELDILTFIVQ